MQVVINVEDSQLQEVMDKQLKALDSEYLGEVVAKAIEEYFRMDNYKNIEKILFRDTSWTSREKELTPLIQNVISKADYSGLQDVVNNCIDTLKKDYTNILLGAISSMITSTILGSYALQDEIRMVAQDQILRTLNQNQG